MINNLLYYYPINIKEPLINISNKLQIKLHTYYIDNLFSTEKKKV